MLKKLPVDLLEAEESMFHAIENSLADTSKARSAVNLKFEGLRLLPLVIRLGRKLQEKNISFALAWPDTGATALAKRDAPELSQFIFSFKDLSVNSHNLDGISLLLCIEPNHYDYEEFFELCSKIDMKIIMINGKLEDGAVGIGSVARDRRKGFLSSWTYIYWLEPLSNGALQRIYPQDWYLFRLDPEGYRYLTKFERKPNLEELQEAFI